MIILIAITKLLIRKKIITFTIIIIIMKMIKLIIKVIKK